jgi:hypothetical protein
MIKGRMGLSRRYYLSDELVDDIAEGYGPKLFRMCDTFLLWIRVRKVALSVGKDFTGTT